jgi:ERCC4-type nuclease
VQRKQFPDDFLASLSDGRLQKEIMQIDSSVAIPLLLLEGRGAGWTIDGRLICGYQRFTRQQMNGILFSLQIEHGIASIWVDSMAQTGPAIMDFRKWTQKHSHKSLTARPGPGTHMKRPWQEHFLQGLPAVGPKTASKIMDHFGRLPFTPPTVEQLAQIDGIGKRKAQAIVGMFE